MLDELKRAVGFTLVTMLTLGGAYHIVLWGLGWVAFPAQAEGSLIRRAGGAVVGSRLVAQPFSRAEYFQPRPSAVDYDAASTGGSNLGPSNPDQLTAVRSRLDAVIAQEGTRPAAVPSEMVTASGSGLDPDIPPSAARLQAARVASVRGIPVARVLDIIEAHVASPALGVFGRSLVNVLELNLAIDAAFGPPTAK